MIAERVRPISLRASNGSMVDRQFRAAFLITQNNDPKNMLIIAEKGLYISKREMEIKMGDKLQTIVADNLIEGSISYEIFSYKA